ncbi:MAG: hypothetical protein MI919_15125, partial [Holophagales bacterium]|nr:hypothetical protein [Holophagales bacterium]
IVSQPSHPWTTGASHLYTREFFSLVRERLTPGGVMVQWMAFAFVDEPLLRSLVATVTDVFPHVELYRPHPGSLLLLASAEPLGMESTASVAIARAPELWARSGVLDAEDVLAARLLDSEGARRFGEGAALNTDSRNLLRMRALEDRQGVLGPAGANRVFAASASLPRVDEEVRIYRVRRLLRQKAVARARQLAGSFEDPVARHTGLALVELASGRLRQGRAGLLRALQLAPSDGEALGALLALERPRIASGQPLPAAAGLGPEARVVVEGWRRAGAGDWPGLSRLEQGLAELGPRHPLFADATRLRVRWRVELGGAERCARALELLSPLLSPVPEPRDLLLRARVGLAAGEPELALAAIEEALASPNPPFRPASRLLQEIPGDPQLDDWRRALLRRVGG